MSIAVTDDAAKGAGSLSVPLQKMAKAVAAQPTCGPEAGKSLSGGSGVVLGDVYATKTQKARGIFTLASIAQHFPYKVPKTAIVNSGTTVEQAWKVMGEVPVFARPCPITPMHGFVDSKVCHGLQDLLVLFEQAKAADPQAEMLLCDPITAHWNAIVTPNMIIIGPGHDGATSGTLTITVPLSGAMTPRWQEWTTDAKVAPGDVPYLELVADKRWWLTQLRGGPAIPFQVDYVPAAMVVEHVVQAEGDLLEWAATVATFKPNTAVWHPDGSLGTHYGVHCVQHKIPIFTSKAPKVGQEIEPLPLPPLDVDALRTGIVAASLIPMDHLKELRAPAVELVMLALHHSAAMRGEHSFWIGVSCCLMTRLGIAAALGEWRHAGKIAEGETSVKASPYSGWDRGKVYSHAFGDIFTYRKFLPSALASFIYGNWGGGFGGLKWGACAQATVRLDEAMHGVFDSRDEAAVTVLVDALNVAVNQAHNNGWWMNKFIGQQSFDMAAQGDLQTALNSLPAIIEIIRVVYTRAEEVQHTLYRWMMAGQLAQVAPTEHGKKAVLHQPLTSAMTGKKGFKIPGLAVKTVPKKPAEMPPHPLQIEAATTSAGASGNKLHIQYQFKHLTSAEHAVMFGKGYISFDPGVAGADMVRMILSDIGATAPSMSGSGATYYPIFLKPVDPLQLVELGKPLLYYVYAGNDQQILHGNKPIVVPLDPAHQAVVWPHVQAHYGPKKAMD